MPGSARREAKRKFQIQRLLGFIAIAGALGVFILLLNNLVVVGFGMWTVVYGVFLIALFFWAGVFLSPSLKFGGKNGARIQETEHKLAKSNKKV